MRLLPVLIALTAIIYGASAAESRADGKMAVPTDAVRAIKTNARAAQKDAAIYQWVRVNREVDRIVADENKVERALKGEAALTARVEALRQAARDLRSARLGHDIKRIEETAGQLIAACDALLK